MPDLKPCPFCGGKAVLRYGDFDGGVECVISCSSGAAVGCFTKQRHWAGEQIWAIESAIKAWNRSTGEEKYEQTD